MLLFKQSPQPWLKFSIVLKLSLLWFTEAEADFEYRVAEGAAIITGYVGSGETVIIPESIDSFAVKEIGDEAFFKNTSFTELTIPSSVTRIGDRAFSGCRGLVKITFQEGLVEIGTEAFMNTLITALQLPDSVVSIGDRAFRQSYLLNSLSLGKGLRRIGDYAFEFNVKIKRIQLPDGLESIGNYAFSKCLNLLVLHIPASVMEIGDNIIFDCREFEDVYVDPTNAHYRSEAGVLFTKDMRRLLGYPIGKYRFEYTIPEGVEEVGDMAFYRVYSLTSVQLPTTLKRIGYLSFFLCKGIRLLELPDGLEFIGQSAFGACEGLRDVTIPATVTEIAERAFDQCPYLLELTFLGHRPDMTDSIVNESPIEKVHYAIGSHGWDAPLAGILPEPIRVGTWADTGPSFNQWFQHQFMGWLQFPSGNWIYQSDFKWMYPVGHQGEGFYFYDTINNLWCWTSEAAFPHVYQLDPIHDWTVF